MSERLNFTPDQEPERLRPNEAQEAKLRQLCEVYRVDYDPDHYFVYPPTSAMMANWCEGWIGGQEGTLYIGVSPEGHSHS